MCEILLFLLARISLPIKHLRKCSDFVNFQGSFGESEKVKWRGTWVVKTVIKRHIRAPVKMYVYCFLSLFPARFRSLFKLVILRQKLNNICWIIIA